MKNVRHFAAAAALIAGAVAVSAPAQAQYGRDCRLQVVHPGASGELLATAGPRASGGSYTIQAFSSGYEGETAFWLNGRIPYASRWQTLTRATLGDFRQVRETELYRNQRGQARPGVRYPQPIDPDRISMRARLNVYDSSGRLICTTAEVDASGLIGSRPTPHYGSPRTPSAPRSSRAAPPRRSEYGSGTRYGGYNRGAWRDN
jgi:hypothetical protein